MTRREPVDPGLDGVLVLDKPIGPTSHDIVALVRRLSGVRRVGHGGTLDPFAAGVLPVFLGRATRIVEYHMADEKAYRALVVFGARSTTDDLDGELTPSEALAPEREAVDAALGSLRGWIEQVPPDHSAVRIAGRRAYEMARHGEKPELKPRRVEIRSLDLVAWDGADPSRPTATLEVRCSAGTYVRAIARDLGERLGSGAYLAALTRTASGPFRIEDAHSLDTARRVLAEDRAGELLLAPDVGLEAYPRLELSAEDLATLAKGQAVRHRGTSELSSGPSGLLRVVDGEGRLAAMARHDGGRLHPEKVFVAPGR
ncbi:MAG: tRNA pseudouridine(55) synthase TruB [Chloroflexota bacterium]|nr:tRNA pseudouridine(55) synthase TruB [Chloroflexota bacterium]